MIPTSTAKTNKEEEVPFTSNCESSSCTQREQSTLEEQKQANYEIPNQPFGRNRDRPIYSY